MVGQQLDYFLAGEGYMKIPSDLPEYTLYFREENSYINVFHVIHYEKNLYIAEEQYRYMKDKIKKMFMGKGSIHDIHILTLMVCQDIKRAKSLCQNDPFCWMIDPYGNRLMIYDNQVSDFYGMRNKLEEFLNHLPESNQEECIAEERARKGKKWIAGMHIPYVTAFFVLANILIFFICTFTSDLLYNIGAFSAGAFLADKEYHRIVTSIFLHWDIDHLVSNMLVLYYLGEVVEKYFGQISYSLIYLSAGIFGNLCSAWYEIHEGAYIHSVGASGAVFGIIGALFVLVCIHKGHLEQITMGRLLFMIVYSLYSGFAGDGINNAAHIGGFICGIAISFLVLVLKKRSGQR